MGKVNVWLKRIYIIVTSLIGTISFLLLAFTLFSHGYLHEDEEFESKSIGLCNMYVISIATLALAIIGVFGACKEKKWALIVFAIGMILGSLFMLFVEMVALVTLPLMMESIKVQHQHWLPLTNASDFIVETLTEAETTFQCCGLDQGYMEWDYNIPESCICTKDSTNPCVAAPRNSSLFVEKSSDEPIMIYEKPCLPYMIEHIRYMMINLLGIMMGFILLWVLSVVLCVVILCKLNKKVSTPTVVYSQEAKAGNYTVLAEAVEFT